MKKFLVSFMVIVFVAALFYIVAYYKETSLWQQFIEFQKSGNALIMEKIHLLRAQFHFSMAITLFLFSLVYGAVHAAGPGHGKLIIINYLVDREQSVFRAVLISAVTSLFHIGSAIVIALAFRSLLLQAGLLGGFGQYKALSCAKVISGILVMGIGVMFIFHRLQRFIPTQVSRHFHNTVLVGLVAGMVPCPLTLTIMLISISFSIFHIGLIVVSGISLGMFLLLFGVGVLTVLSRDKMINWLQPNRRIMDKIKLFPYVQGAVFVLIGLFLISSGLCS